MCAARIFFEYPHLFFYDRALRLELETRLLFGHERFWFSFWLGAQRFWAGEAAALNITALKIGTYAYTRTRPTGTQAKTAERVT